MNASLSPVAAPDLTSALEPLASYICAADRPGDTLRRVVEALITEANLTNDAALRHWATTAYRSFDLAA